MDSFKGPCPHHSMPVEMDERMSPSVLDSAWFPSCERCQRNTGSSTQEQGGPGGAAPSRNPDPEWRTAAARPPPPAHLDEGRFLAQRSTGPAGPPSWPRVPSMEESLELPLPLVSDPIYSQHGAARHPAAHLHDLGPVQRSGVRRCACCPPANPPRHDHSPVHYDPYYPADLHHRQAGPQPQPLHQHQHQHQQEHQYQQPPAPVHSRPDGCAAQHRDVMLEVSVNRSLSEGRGAVRGEIRKTISLPEESRHVFITYSVDTAKYMLPFVKFLTDQGFKPSIDMFDDPIRRMSINKWMDSFLNDKSVLIIVVVSPGYKEDVEGDGDDEHGLHTKYIHNQIQNEFIQQGCLNFRLVPVLFPNATKRHVPNWLQSTRIYRWPLDTEDLLLRLLREERYIIPQCGADLTLTIRPL
ncbi:adapter protein CIKS [Salarias fasciatus]|nr:adapter protein CIKS-like [Salarias fasciatus]XP_029965487.1 adapter protein CIKS-like [Salarias fasciatus]